MVYIQKLTTSGHVRKRYKKWVVAVRAATFDDVDGHAAESRPKRYS
jgi:hypothetical protein